MSTIFARSGIAGIGVIAFGALTPMPAAAVTSFGFENIFPINETSEGSIDSEVGSFSATVEEDGSSLKILFKNNIATSGYEDTFIADIYVDDRTDALSLNTLNYDNIEVDGVDFKEITSVSSNFPQGNKIGFESDEELDFVFSRGASNGVNPDEALGILFDYSDSLANFLLAVDSGDIRFGLHIQGIPEELSDSIVSAGGASAVDPIPLPFGAVLLISAFGVAAGASQFRRKKG